MPFFEKDDFRGVASNRVRRPYKLFKAILDDILGAGVRADDACGAICGAPSPASHGAAPTGRRSATLLARPAMWWPGPARRRVASNGIAAVNLGSSPTGLRKRLNVRDGGRSRRS
jgi:hypothetical protein